MAECIVSIVELVEKRASIAVILKQVEKWRKKNGYRASSTVHLNFMRAWLVLTNREYIELWTALFEIIHSTQSFVRFINSPKMLMVEWNTDFDLRIQLHIPFTAIYLIDMHFVLMLWCWMLMNWNFMFFFVVENLRIWHLVLVQYCEGRHFVHDWLYYMRDSDWTQIWIGLIMFATRTMANETIMILRECKFICARK